MIVSLVEVGRVVQVAHLRQAKHRLQHRHREKANAQLKYMRQPPNPRIAVHTDRVECMPQLADGIWVAGATEMSHGRQERCAAEAEEHGTEVEEEEEAETEVKFMPCAIRNLTELQLHFTTESKSITLLPASGSAPHCASSSIDCGGGVPLTQCRPGSTIAFESPEQRTRQREAEEVGGSMHARLSHGLEAVTTNCEDLVSAARMGNHGLVYELLRRRANVDSVHSTSRPACSNAIAEPLIHPHLGAARP